jgi:tetratricopeptide (TPR) repeat protein
MTFEQALKQGDLDVARAILDELVELPDTGALWMPECYADLAREYDRRGGHDDAIALHERAIALGWDSIPPPRSDIAEFHLRAGREDEAAAIWAELKAADPEDVWLYNAAGLSYNEVGEHELAIEWLAEGIELAMGTHDPEGIVNQLSAVRRESLGSLGRDLDELEQRVDPFLEEWRSEDRTRRRRLARRIESANSVPVFETRPAWTSATTRRSPSRSPGSPPASTRLRSSAGRASPRIGRRWPTAITPHVWTAT